MDEKEKLKKLKGLLKIIKCTHPGDRQIVKDMYDVLITHAVNAMSMRCGNPNMFQEEK
jgi:hypothetical protein